MKQALLLMIFILGVNLCFCQKPSCKIQADTTCRISFLSSRIRYTNQYSSFIFLPVTIEGDKYRIMLKSKDLHQYIKNMDSTLIDTMLFKNEVLNIIYGKKKLTFNILRFEYYVPGVKFVTFDKPNPYKKEIMRYGLNNFIKNRFYKDDIIKRGNNISYHLIYKNEYSRINEYNLNYLKEALFEYNFIFEGGDVSLGFTKIGCSNK